MTPLDLSWFEQCCTRGFLKAPFLEVGSAKVQGVDNLRDIAQAKGVAAVGTDLQQMPGVDHVVDFSVPSERFRQEWALGQFATVAVFNVLEHTFDPIGILDNALHCLKPGGTLLVLAPAIWPVHNFPGDFTRLLPDWYTAYARRHGLGLREHSWISSFGMEPITAANGDFPTYLNRKSLTHAGRHWISRISHKVLNTYGRTHWATHCAIGAAFERAN